MLRVAIMSLILETGHKFPAQQFLTDNFSSASRYNRLQRDPCRTRVENSLPKARSAFLEPLPHLPKASPRTPRHHSPPPHRPPSAPHPPSAPKSPPTPSPHPEN